MIKFVRIYTPFIITLFTFANALLFIVDEDTTKIAHLISILSGNSILLTIYIYTVSLRMCVWYKLNLLCLLLTQILNLAYNYLDIDNALYLWAIILICSLGIVCFLIFKRFIKKQSNGK